jgi:class I fructose-bisphosphate aldolase
MALDHGLGMGPQEGLINADTTILKAVEGGVNAVLTTVGIAKRYPRLFGNIGLILRLDGAFTIYTGGLERMDLVFRVKAALRIGADAVCCMGYVGGDEERRTLKYLGEIAQECDLWQIPLLAEMLVMDGSDPTPEKIALAARTGVESGADFIKTSFVGDESSYKHVVEGCFRPLLVLGGSKQNELQLLESVEAAITAGAAGAVIGRNIWQHSRPDLIAKALSMVIHQELSAEDAYLKSGLTNK